METHCSALAWRASWTEGSERAAVRGVPESEMQLEATWHSHTHTEVAPYQQVERGSENSPCGVHAWLQRAL